MSSFDVVVCGLGVMGSATLRDLSRRGLRVLGIDRFAPGHDRGSSHGATRVIRMDYFEHPSYVPLLRRAYELWHELEQASGRNLIHITRIVAVGAPDCWARGSWGRRARHLTPRRNTRLSCNRMAGSSPPSHQSTPCWLWQR